MRDRVAYWLELLAWAAAWGFTLLSLEIILHEDVRRSSDLQALIAAALGMVVVMLGPMVYREWLAIRAAVRSWRGLCTACGYSLRGLAPVFARHGRLRCPECGRQSCGHRAGDR